MKTVCPKCGIEVKSENKFCPNCGTQLDWNDMGEHEKAIRAVVDGKEIVICPKCGQNHYYDAEVCSDCGYVFKPDTKEKTEDNKSKTSKETSTVKREECSLDQVAISKPYQRLKEKKNILIGCAIGVIIIIAILIIGTFLFRTGGSITGDFDESNAQRITIHGLECAAPANWDKKEIEDVDASEGMDFDKYNEDGEWIAGMRILYIEDDADLDELAESYISDNVNDSNSDITPSSTEIQGCDARVINYEDDEMTHKEIYVETDLSTFSINMLALNHIFDEQEFDKILNAIDFNGYVNQNLCLAEGCINEKEKGSDYCYEHICQKEGCNKQGTVEADSGTLYCEPHKAVCSVKNCNNKKQNGFDYCAQHKCNVENCDNQKQSGSEYCSDHIGEICEADGCERVKEDNSDYCSKHQSLEYETGITYDQLARNPEQYIGDKVKFSGEVLQVIEGGGEVQIRLAVNGNYDTVVLGQYSDSLISYRVLEGDNITIYGMSVGTITYESTMGASITIPGVDVEKIDR